MMPLFPPAPTRSIALAILLTVSAPAVNAEEVQLASKGEAHLVVSLAPNAPDSIRNSATRLANLLTAITGAPFVHDADSPKGKIILGLRSDYPHLLPEAEKEDAPTWKDRYRLLSKEGNLYIIGETELGVTHGVSDLLHRLGYRYLMPPKAWEVIPEHRELSIDVDVTEQPAFATRLLFMVSGGDRKIENAARYHIAMSNFGAWRRHMRAFSSFQIRTGHAWHQMVQRNEQAFLDNPHWIAKMEGDWRDDATLRRNVKFHLEYDDLIQVLQQDSLNFLWDNPRSDTVSVDPTDGGNWPKTSPLGSPSDQVVHLANAVSEAVREELPDRKVAFYAYHMHSPPPTVELNKGIIVNIATGFIRGGYTVDELMKGWREKGAELGIREYTNVFHGSWDLPGGNYVGFSPQKSQETIRRFYQNGARYWISETDNAWGAVGLGSYVAFHTLWNPVNGPSATELTDDFISSAFGKGSKAMAKYYSLVAPENHPIVSEDLTGRMYDALAEALKEELKPAERTRVTHLIAYTRFVELMHAFRNAEPGEPIKKAYRELVQWAYDTRDFQMFSSLHVMARLVRQEPELALIRDEVIEQPVRVPGEDELVALMNLRRKEARRLSFTPRSYAQELKPIATIAKAAEAQVSSTKPFAFAQQNRLNWLARAKDEVLMLEIRALGKRPNPPRPTDVALKLVDDVLDEAAFETEVPADGKWQTVKLKAPIAGLYEISLLTHGGFIEVRWPEGTPVVMPSGQIGGSTLYDEWDASFYVPPGVDRIGGYSARARGELLDERGKRLHDFSSENGPGYFDIAIAPEATGRVFRFRKATGAKTLMTVPPYLARRGSELLIPADAGDPERNP